MSPARPCRKIRAATAMATGTRPRMTKVRVRPARRPRPKKNPKISRMAAAGLMSLPHQVFEDGLEVVIGRRDLLDLDPGLQHDRGEPAEEDVALAGLDDERTSVPAERHLEDRRVADK